MARDARDIECYIYETQISYLFIRFGMILSSSWPMTVWLKVWTYGCAFPFMKLISLLTPLFQVTRLESATRPDISVRPLSMKYQSYSHSTIFFNSNIATLSAYGSQNTGCPHYTYMLGIR